MQCPILGFKRILQHAYVEITLAIWRSANITNFVS